MNTETIPIIRSLYAWEIHEARRVFAEGLHYERVRVHECSRWPQMIDQFGTRLHTGRYKPKPNAITLGNHCYFSSRLLSAPVEAHNPTHFKIGWLIHELTHVWQYQHMGWRYLVTALGVLLRYGRRGYEFGGEDGLVDRFKHGFQLTNFNLEQQGDIARSYYDRLVRDQDVRAWVPFIDQFQISP